MEATVSHVTQYLQHKKSRRFGASMRRFGWSDNSTIITTDTSGCQTAINVLEISIDWHIQSSIKGQDLIRPCI